MHAPEVISGFSSSVVRSAVVLLAAATAVLGVGVAGPASAALHPAVAGKRLAVLGDSGASGEGAGGYFRGTAGAHGCHRSPHAWGFQLARQTPQHRVRALAKSHLLACSGAGSLSSQLKAYKKLRPKPGLVTITMGWDAVGIDGLLANCSSHNCVSDGKLAAAKRRVGSKLVGLAGQFLQVRGATVLLVGYPQFIATSARCPGLRGFSRAERRGLTGLIGELDSDLNAVAAKTGLRYVAVTGALAGHELCTGSHSWVSTAGHQKTAGQTAIAKSVGRYINAHGLAAATPTAGPEPSTLRSVAALSSSYAWAVGERATELWNGRRWTLVANPLTHNGAVLTSVAVTSARNAWAVGRTSGKSALILHWNGVKWAVAAIPAVNAALTSVAASSAANVWAVGITDDNARAKSVILHWNGSKWSRVPSPNPGGAGALTSVAAGPGDTAWAVGFGGHGPLITRWTGAKWVLTPSHGLALSLLASVVAPSSTDAWIVGGIGTDALVMHWDGKAWKKVALPALGQADLTSVSASSPKDAWAVGNTRGGLLVLHWNGSVWKRIKSPALPTAPGGQALDGVAAISSIDVWAVGFHGSKDGALRVHWNGTAWKRE